MKVSVKPISRNVKSNANNLYLNENISMYMVRIGVDDETFFAVLEIMNGIKRDFFFLSENHKRSSAGIIEQVSFGYNQQIQ